MPKAMHRALKSKASRMQASDFDGYPGNATWKRWSADKRRKWLRDKRGAYIYGTMRNRGD